MTNNKPNDVRVVPVELLENALACAASNNTSNWSSRLCEDLRLALAHPADQQGEPFAWAYIEQAECGAPYKPDLSVSRWSLMPDGYTEHPLYRHAQPATAKVDERAEFEAWYGSDAESGIGEEEIRSWRKGDRYSNQYERCNICWVAWQARAKLNGGQ